MEIFFVEDTKLQGTLTGNGVLANNRPHIVVKISTDLCYSGTHAPDLELFGMINGI